jgi:hypothetical protein
MQENWHNINIFIGAVKKLIVKYPNYGKTKLKHISVPKKINFIDPKR